MPSYRSYAKPFQVYTAIRSPGLLNYQKASVISEKETFKPSIAYRLHSQCCTVLDIPGPFPCRGSLPASLHEATNTFTETIGFVIPK
jgi:hypothetical protein